MSGKNILDLGSLIQQYIFFSAYPRGDHYIRSPPRTRLKISPTLKCFTALPPLKNLRPGGNVRRI